MRSTNSRNHDAILTPRQFIRQFAPSLSSIQLPDFCIFSLIPHLKRYFSTQPVTSSPFVFKSVLYFFDKPVPHVFIYGGMGAPVAGLSLEVSIELGIQNILILGTCGLLNHKIQSGDVIVPERFIREEGTSLHYVPQDISIETNSRLNKMICHTFQSHQISCYQGLHWTTDAPFRETTDKIARYSGQGCHSLDMESSALFAISQYYQKKTAAILIGSDHLSDTGWIPPQPSFQGISDRIQEIIPLLPEILQAF